MAQYKVGQRVKLLAPLVNSNSKWMPIEKDMPVGLEGTIVYISTALNDGFGQLSVNWDNGKSLGLFVNKDNFTIIGEENDTNAEAGVGSEVREGSGVGS